MYEERKKKYAEFRRVFSAHLTEFEDPTHEDCFIHGYRIALEDAEKSIIEWCRLEQWNDDVGLLDGIKELKRS